MYKYAYIIYYDVIQRITAEGAYINSPNHVASNGVVHLVDHVMMPPNGTIADILASRPELSTLNAAVKAAGLTAALQGHLCYCFRIVFVKHH